MNLEGFMIRTSQETKCLTEGKAITPVYISRVHVPAKFANHLHSQTIPEPDLPGFCTPFVNSIPALQTIEQTRVIHCNLSVHVGIWLTFQPHTFL
jgi:hypothetical protein